MRSTEVTRYGCAREMALQRPDKRKIAAVTLVRSMGKTLEQFQRVKAGHLFFIIVPRHSFARERRHSR
jgi:hypothetical protein